MRVEDWAVLDVNGNIHQRRQIFEQSEAARLNQPMLGIQEIVVQTDSNTVPVIRAILNPAKGKSVRTFTRGSISMSATGGAPSSSNMAVLEINMPDGSYIRAYLKDNELIISDGEFNG